MPCLICPSNSFRAITHAMAKSVAAKLRQARILSVAGDWENRAALCETCPLRVIRRGISHCGKPFLERMERDETSEGCGCPCRLKAKDPQEHCPLDSTNRPARKVGRLCNCKWCAGGG